MGSIKSIRAGLFMAATAGLLASANSASAVPFDITYDLTAPIFGPFGPNNPSGGLKETDHSLVLNGVTLTISAHDFESGGGVITARNDALITSSANGLGTGVFSDLDGRGVSGRTDGLDLDELLSFAFTRNGDPVNIQLIEAVFQTFNSPARVRLFIEEQNISITTLFGVSNNIVQLIDPGSNPGSLDFEPFSLTGSLFEFGTKTDPSQWRIVSLNVRVPVPVPESGTLAIFGLGLLGLGFSRRRKTA